MWTYNHLRHGPKEGQGPAGQAEGCPSQTEVTGMVQSPHQCQGPGSPASLLPILEHIETTRSSLLAGVESPGQRLQGAILS